MTDNEVDNVATKMVDRIMAAVHMAERLKGIEVQAERNASDLESEKATRARENERTQTTLEKMQTSITNLTKSNWVSAGAIAAAIFLWDIAKHFIKI